ncbi:phosphatase PAP2 family protein [Acuticoccus mangrovi]|uniref:Bromoperoxidase n=1 Tax=Acuticoccus mangrovi TaxID=2796142 RepID=A0A934MGK0_9HYPH|nr:hypothetical protein [Acuticoccus mangrovi]MBJ3776005.1 hypothetical protein [Acuticoccus mangrovi]
MTNITLMPVPSGAVRAEMARRVRHEAADVARARAHPPLHRSDGAAQTFSPPLYSFTKGLAHDAWGGLIEAKDLQGLISEINQDKPGSAPGETPLPGTYSSGLPAPFAVNKYGGTFKLKVKGTGARNWESPLAGHALEINGPDPDQLTMPPAPALGSAELIAEIAEVYAMALLRDVPFTEWDGSPVVDDVLAMLNALDFFKSDAGLDTHAKARRAARFAAGEPQTLTAANLFRGSTRGAKSGPYISQFMLIGNKEEPHPNAPGHERVAAPQKPDDALTRARAFVPSFMDGGEEGLAATPKGHEKGAIRYGVQAIPQLLRPHQRGVDHMVDWASWHDVQNGANRKGFDYFESASRFISTPRDIATYVHFDALYQAYLNACLLLLGEQAASDVGLPEGPFLAAGQGHDTRDGFALFGGPHILTLVTEVATRALKAVRRQKFGIHLRGRPETLAGAITLAWNAAQDGDLAAKLGNTKGPLDAMTDALVGCGLLGKIADHNAEKLAWWQDEEPDVSLGWIEESRNALLPMAFPEGSPMHPSYGAGHATVAGACVTVLKAFFEMFAVTEGSAFVGGAVKRGKLDLKRIMREAKSGPPAGLFGAERSFADLGIPAIYAPDWVGSEGQSLSPTGVDPATITIQGELDKLAANISIGRDFAGVHYYTDYYESLRLGERIAVGLLQEQMLTYREPLSMRLTGFDGDQIMIVGTGGSRHQDGPDAIVYVWPAAGGGATPESFKEWWQRAQS